MWFWFGTKTILVGGFNHLEKSEFVNGKNYPIYEMEKKCLKPPISHSCINLGKLSYFTNLNSSAIWGWFPKNKPWFPVGENSEVVIKFTQINGFQASTQFPKKIETSWILLFTAVNFGCSSDVYLKRHMFKKVIQFNIFPTQNHKTSCFAWTLKHVDKLRESRLWYSRQFPVQKKIQCNISP